MLVFLTVAAILSGSLGSLILIAASSAIHEIEGFLLLLIAAVLTAGAGVVNALQVGFAKTTHANAEAKSHKGNMNCAKCGSAIVTDANFCTACGTSTKTQPEAQRSFVGRKIVIGFLIAVCGFFGLALIGAIIGPNSSVPRTSSSGPVGPSLFDRNKDYVIRVGGTRGVTFRGNYTAIDRSGKSDSRSVEGVVPEEFHVRAYIVSVSFQKQGERGQLTVELVKDGQVVKSSETSAQYGVVMAASN